MQTHIFNVSAILSADNLSSFFKLREREYVIAILRKSVGRNSLMVYLAF